MTGSVRQWSTQFFEEKSLFLPRLVNFADSQTNESLQTLQTCKNQEPYSKCQATWDGLFCETCAFIITIILYPQLNNISSKLCGDLNKSISTSSKSTVSAAALVKDGKVVLEDISSCDAEHQSRKHLYDQFTSH